jgi:cytochrome c oxidase assembly factor CtaG
MGSILLAVNTIAVVASAWRWNHVAMAGCAALLAISCAFNGIRNWRGLLWFFSGAVLLAAILCSPLDLLARNYLFTGEAIERVLLALTVPYLFVRGTTEKVARIRIPYLVAWIAGMGTLSIWFLPRLLNAALVSDAVRSLQILTIVAGGVMFWWPLHSPVQGQRIRMVPNALLYLTAATVWCSLLGLFLAFEQPWYFPRYANPLDTLNIADSLVRDWSFTRENDQQTGGLLFWIGTATVLLSEVMFTYYRWYVLESKNSRETQRERTSPA